MSRVLTRKIAAARRRHVTVSLACGAGAAAFFAFAALGVGLLVDRAVELSWSMRFVLLLTYALGAAVAFVWLAVRPIVRGPDDEEIALAVERHEPTFATRLIAAVQFSRLQTSPAGMNEGMIRALIGQAEELAGSVDFPGVFPTRRTWQWCAGAIGVGVVVFTCVGLAGPMGSALVRRAALENVPLPRATQIEIVGGDRVVARGDPLTISVLARGVLPDTGTLRLTFPSGDAQRFTLTSAVDHPGQYDVTLDSALESFEFSAYLNDARSDRAYKVTVVERPAVASLAVRQVFPAYTKLGVVPKQPADLTLLSGSTLLVDVTSTVPVSRQPKSGKISRVTFIIKQQTNVATTQTSPGVTTDVMLDVDSADAKKLTTTKPLAIPPGTTGMTIHLVDETGLESRDPALYRITLVDDKVPAVTIRSPAEREETVTRRAYVPIGFVATDDFAIKTLRVHYRVVQSTGEADSAAAGENAVATAVVEKPAATIELDLGDNPAAVRGVYRLQLAKLTPLPSEGDLIEWWLEAVDTNDATGPGVTRSEVYRAKVVSEIEKRNELLARFGDSSTTFTDLADTQQTVNEKLGGAILNSEPKP